MCGIVGIVKLDPRETVDEARLTSLRAFGRLYRFVAGCGATAQRVANVIARGWRGWSRAVSSGIPMAAGS
jgi:hypothetical protein